MIRARLSLDAKGGIAAFHASGHADRGVPGTDVVCAAFSVLARTAYRSLQRLAGIELRGRADEPGLIDFKVLAAADEVERAKGIADFLTVGMADLAREFPDAVVLTIE